MKITKEYRNHNNGGVERVTRDGDNYYINSFINDRLGWMGVNQVTRQQMVRALKYTNAPQDVVDAMVEVAA